MRGKLGPATVERYGELTQLFVRMRLHEAGSVNDWLKHREDRILAALPNRAVVALGHQEVAEPSAGCGVRLPWEP